MNLYVYSRLVLEMSGKEILSASVLSRFIAWFGNESIADFKHSSMTQQFNTKTHVFHGAVVP